MDKGPTVFLRNIRYCVNQQPILFHVYYHLIIFVLGVHYGSPAFSPPSPMRGCGGMAHSTPTYLPGTSPPVFSHMAPVAPHGAHELMAIGPVSLSRVGRKNNL